jgi:hypothetical protein
VTEMGIKIDLPVKNSNSKMTGLFLLLYSEVLVEKMMKVKWV